MSADTTNREDPPVTTEPTPAEQAAAAIYRQAHGHRPNESCGVCEGDARAMVAAIRAADNTEENR